VFHRETLERGRATEIARGEPTAIYHGWMHDQYEHGATTLLLSLELFGQRWLPDVRDTGVHAFARHCVRIASASADRVELDVAIQPAHEYDSDRCQFGCCPSGAERAPDGTIECCFCPDEPMR
jgi:hypothetical protein